jgi:hypothetical protein
VKVQVQAHNLLNYEGREAFLIKVLQRIYLILNTRSDKENIEQSSMTVSS